MSNHKICWLLMSATALMLASNSALAASSNNKSQPITITSDNAELSRPDNVSTYTGNVVVVRGGLTLTGNKLVIHRLKDDSYKADLTGTPATLDRKPQAADEQRIKGHSERIIYYTAKAEVTLRGKAVVDRGGDVIHSEVIHHNLNTQKTVAGDDTSSHKRVKITLSPKHGGSNSQ